ncbi:GNAT family N-acetyltransferase [Parahaliea mediterranea]|uniref:GNAT family N-acetyltransferase n=1 Tax=Parahaliea mediterranea TaxID=651086 RepID=A0A939DH84_9GAMM|nr:GNAT family N-acetyltransferase [Parahaliea mediterranea]MBN7797427.1 GNAT family N-acetyltransferase [Parahaliea mediterranea]
MRKQSRPEHRNGTIPVPGRRHGALYLLTRALRRLIPGVSIRYYWLVVQAVADSPRLPRKASSRGLGVEVVPQSQYQAQWFPRSEKIVASRYAQGAVCFVAFAGDGQAAGCIWIVPGRYDEDEVRCRFVPAPEGESAWDFDVFIHPKYRLGRTFLYLWDAADDWMRNRGIHWSASRIDGFNAESLKAHRSMGARRVGRAYFLCIGNRYLSTGDNGWQLAFLPGFPWIHCSRTRRPEVLVDAGRDG